MLESLKSSYNITILPRDKTQLAHYRQEKFAGINVPEKPLKFDEIARQCALSIGAGGSMTRELAILGIPTISVYQAELLEVDKFLLERKLMLHEPRLVSSQLSDIMHELEGKEPDLQLLEKGRQSYQLFKEEIYKFKK